MKGQSKCGTMKTFFRYYYLYSYDIANLKHPLITIVFE